MDNSPIPFPDRPACLQFAEAAYKGQLADSGGPLMQQAVAIADKVDALLTDHMMLGGVILPTQRLTLDSAYCAGLLFATLQVIPSFCFEEIVDLANLDTAQYVAAVTPDFRLPRPQRHRELIGRLYVAPLPVQTIKLAEILIKTKAVLPLFKMIEHKEEKQRHRDWCMAAQEILGVMHKLQEQEAFDMPLRRLQTVLGQLIKICDNLSQRDKILANIANSNGHLRPGAAT